MSPWLSDALLRSQSDERLAALAREGRERAFTTLVERYRKPLLAFARRQAGEGRAEDVMQQALLQAWAALQQGAEVRHASGWLHQIVRHAAWKAVARAGDGQPLTGEEPAAGDFESAVEQRLAVQALWSSMAELPERQRQALLQTELEGRSRAEVATALGLSPGAVRQLVHRARITLRTAATALTPWPLVTWAARGLGATTEGGLSSPVAEAVTSAGGAGLAGTLVKAGAVVVTTGALAAGAVAPHSGRARRVATVEQEVASRPAPASRARARQAAAPFAATATPSAAGRATLRAAASRPSTARSTAVIGEVEHPASGMSSATPGPRGSSGSGGSASRHTRGSGSGGTGADGAGSGSDPGDTPEDASGGDRPHGGGSGASGGPAWSPGAGSGDPHDGPGSGGGRYGGSGDGTAARAAGWADGSGDGDSPAGESGDDGSRAGQDPSADPAGDAR